MHVRAAEHEALEINALTILNTVRAQKSIGVVGGSPDYEPVKGFEAPDVTARTFSYSPDGRLFANVLPDRYVVYERPRGPRLNIRAYLVFKYTTPRVLNCFASCL